jgi:Mg-chelatase subunit ChlD
MAKRTLAIIESWTAIAAIAGLLLSCGSCGSSSGGTASDRSGVSTAGAAANRAATGAGGSSLDFGLPPGMITVPVNTNPNGLSGSSCQEAVVLFVIDGSGSMGETFGTATRWTALRGALLDPQTGFITRFQKEALFGMLLYDGAISGMNRSRNSQTTTAAAPMCGAKSSGAMCPRLVNVPPLQNNAAAIDKMFPARELGGSTPTDKALNVAVDQLMTSMKSMGNAAHPHFIVLATDGEPNDLCTMNDGSDTTPQKMCVLQAVDTAAAAGIITFVISLAGNDQALEAHLVDVAKHGNPKDPTAHTYSPMTPDDLVQALRTVLTSALGCELQ